MEYRIESQKKNSIIPFTPITPQQQSQVGWGSVGSMDRSRINRDNWDAYRVRKENARLWQQQTPAQPTSSTRKGDWYQNMYIHDPDFFNTDFVSTLGDQDYNSDGTINWY